VVRRVRPTPGSQLALFTVWDYHAFVTNRPGDVLEVEAEHRRHAVVEQRIAELKSAGLAHLPSGRFMANAAWLALAVMAHNLGRAVGRLAGPDLEKGHHEHPTTANLHRPGTPRAQRPTTTSTTTSRLAVGSRPRPGSPENPGHPDALLTRNHRPDDQDLGEAGRQAGSNRPARNPIDATRGPDHHRSAHVTRSDGGFGLSLDPPMRLVGRACREVRMPLRAGRIRLL
jgi:hypothetical protein